MRGMSPRLPRGRDQNANGVRSGVNGYIILRRLAWQMR
jgi:hypothetical protein